MKLFIVFMLVGVFSGVGSAGLNIPHDLNLPLTTIFSGRTETGEVCTLRLDQYKEGIDFTVEGVFALSYALEPFKRKLSRVQKESSVNQEMVYFDTETVRDLFDNITSQRILWLQFDSNKIMRSFEVTEIWHSFLTGEELQEEIVVRCSEVETFFNR